MLDQDGVSRLARLIHKDFFGHISLPEFETVVLKAMELRLKTMHPKFQRILELRYLDEHTLAQTATKIRAEFGETDSTALSTISAIERREITKLKDFADRVTGTGVDPESLDYSDTVRKNKYVVDIEATAKVSTQITVSAGSKEEAHLIAIKKALEAKPKIWNVQSVTAMCLV